MLHILAKIAGFLLQPSHLMLIAIGVGLAFAWREASRRRGLRIAAAALALYVLAGLVPLGNALLLPLEQRFADAPTADAVAGPLAGIVILGGFEDGWVSSGRPGLTVNEAAERLTEGLRLAVKRPEARIVFTGGVGRLWPAGVAAGGPVGKLIADLGVSPKRIVLEERSRNTLENALFTRDLVTPAPGERWLLVTSAYHMPRSVGVFRRAAFDVVPYPVDYRTRDAGDVWRLFDRVPAGHERLDLAAREWIGLVAYRLMGRTDALLPGPAE
jgi:uncharacterized SAM-binding protein YcdF (DUF218 family)